MNKRKIIVALICLFPSYVASSVLDIRTVSSSPLLYNELNMGGDSKVEFTAALFGAQSFAENHMASVLSLNGKPYFTLNEAGPSGAIEVDGDINPKWLAITNDTSSSAAGSYNSVVTLKPQVSLVGSLLRFAGCFESCFFDIRSAFLRCRTIVEIDEVGGGDGAFGGLKTFKDAMSREKWNYGQMGSAQTKLGLDNIQLKLGFISRLESDSMNESSLAGYLLFEIPTGKGSKSEWAFEPRVGKNHFGIGLGIDEYYVMESGQIVIGANWRYLIGATEKRSFDFKSKPWSRYMGMRDLNSAGSLDVFDGINEMTLNAKVVLGNQVNAYLRWVKQWDSLQFEMGYNFFYREKEKISYVADFANKFGIAPVMATPGATQNKAHMGSGGNDAKSYTDLGIENPGVVLTTSDLDLSSGAVGTQLVSSASAHLQYVSGKVRCGLGASFEGAHSDASYALWNAWLNLGCMF